jgi:hypothetical protein
MVWRGKKERKKGKPEKEGFGGLLSRRLSESISLRAAG